MNNYNDEQAVYMKQQLREQYEHLCAMFGIYSRTWSELHTKMSILAFCPANQKSIIAEYFMLEEFVADAKAWGVPYFYGIDEFLEVYHDTIYGRVRLDKED